MNAQGGLVEHPQFAPGAVVAGKYRVQRALEKGGMAVLVVAIHEALEQQVAIKYLPLEEQRTEGARERFLREGRAAVRLESPHAVRVLDVDILEDGTPFMVMELLHGMDLSALVKGRGKLPYAQAVDFILQALDAVAEAHAHGIVHRDLKPSNLFLARRKDGSHIIKVLDFGISKVSGVGVGSGKVETLTHSRSLMGTPHYMSPEQLRDAKTVDGRSDVWSIGVTLYHLLTATEAFDRSNVHAVLTAVLEAEPVAIRELAPDVPEELEAVVMQCLRKDRDERYDTCGELAEALAPFGTGASAAEVQRAIALSTSVRVGGEDETAPDVMAKATRGRPPSQRTVDLSEGSGKRKAADALPSRSYRLLAQLGQGAIAKVFVGVEASPGSSELRALKRLSRDAAQTPELRAMFFEEARIAGRMRHPNVVETYELSQDGKHHFLSMEYVEGPSLEQILRAAERAGVPMPTELRLRVVADVLAGLHYAHELHERSGRPLGIVHRDVSPDNILVTLDGSTKLIDFGIAKAVDAARRTRAGTVKGKDVYMAPEQVRGARVDRRADVFAAGILIWEAATGRRIWEGLSEAEQLERLAEGDIPPLAGAAPGIDVRLARICQRALAADVAARYPTAEDLRAELEDYLASRTPTTAADVGAYLLDTFGERRSEIRAILDQQLRAPTAEKIPYVSWLGTRTSSSKIGAGQEASDRGARTARRVAPARPRLMGPFLGGVVGVLVVAAGVVVWQQAARTPPNAAAASSDLVTLTVKTTPPNADVLLDGVPLGRAPASAKLKRDGALHRVRVEAPGHAPHMELVPFDTASVVVEVALKPEEPAPSTSAAPGASASASATSPTATPSSTSAATRLTAVVAPRPTATTSVVTGTATTPSSTPAVPADARTPEPKDPPSAGSIHLDRDDPWKKKKP